MMNHIWSVHCYLQRACLILLSEYYSPTGSTCDKKLPERSSLRSLSVPDHQSFINVLHNLHCCGHKVSIKKARLVFKRPFGSVATASQSNADCCLGRTLPPRFASSALISDALFQRKLFSFCFCCFLALFQICDNIIPNSDAFDFVETWWEAVQVVLVQLLWGRLCTRTTLFSWIWFKIRKISEHFNS